MPDTDWSAWPLVVVNAKDSAAGSGRQYLLGVLGEALERNEEFAVVVEQPASSESSGGGGIMKILRNYRPGLKARCRGIAFVLSPEQAKRSHKVVKAGSKILGCPTAAVHDVGEGRTWAGTQLAAAGINVPGTGQQ